MEDFIKPTSEQWKNIFDDIENNEGKAVEIDNQFGPYMVDYFTNVLPPIYHSSVAVISSEPYSFDEEGRNTYITFFKKEEQYYGMIASTKTIYNTWELWKTKKA
jgi:hypothetical protein